MMARTTDMCVEWCREGTFKLIESGEPFYPRHLSDDSKDFMQKVTVLCPLCRGTAAI